jgi:antitoxin component YwqK of YwqJK toxin-antitoxin module
MKEENEVKWEVGYRDNGQKFWETPYVNGERHGIETWWYENGKKWIESPHVNGDLHGIETCWHEDGSLWFVAKWNQGQLVVGFEFKISEVPEGKVPEIDIFESKYYLKQNKQLCLVKL